MSTVVRCSGHESGAGWLHRPGQHREADGQRLVAWEGGLTVFDIAPEPLAELEKLGARVASSVADLAAECGVISVMVNTDEQVRDVMGEILGAAKAGTVVAVHSTISPDLPPRLEDLTGRHDLLFVDAPVSGGAMVRTRGRWRSWSAGPTPRSQP